MNQGSTLSAGLLAAGAFGHVCSHISIPDRALLAQLIRLTC